MLVSVWLALLAPYRMPIVPADPWNPPLVAECETIEDLNPGGPLFDMLDWMTLDADLRATSHMQSEPPGAPGAYVLGTIVRADSVTYLKTNEGDTWDKNLVDDVGIWAWRTETAWNQPHTFTQFRRAGQILTAPRFARGGFPGSRWINCDSAYARHDGCAVPTAYGHLGYVIHELYGPYDYEPGWGDVRGPILKLAYFYGCSSISPDSCSSVEITWLHQRYGPFVWRLYARRGDGRVLVGAPPATVYLAPGVIQEFFPCDDFPLDVRTYLSSNIRR